nr:galactosylgalactosylxylosylprotein 3-beta-glucuronosyltransferase S-like isoform X3 [Cherax quadricarinatus]
MMSFKISERAAGSGPGMRWEEDIRPFLSCIEMSRRQRIVMTVIILGSFVYVILTQAVHMLDGLPGEPVHPEVRKFCSAMNKQKVNRGSPTSPFPNLTTEPFMRCKIIFLTLEILNHSVAIERKFQSTSSLIQLTLLNAKAENESSPIIYVVTPTYKRPEMVAELTRLGQTLSMVQNIHWIVAEDSATCSRPITGLLQRLGLPYTHLATPMPDVYRKERYVPRGVSNRRAALQWVRDYGKNTGVLFFLDDDNAIDIRLFEEMRSTETVSMWPVGLIGEYTVSSPVVKNGKVVGFYDGWPAGRKFQVDMAGFAVGVGYMKKQKKVTMPYIAGHEEDGFLKSLNININEIEVKANGCTDILVWHTRTAKNPLRNLNIESHQNDNIKVLTDNMKQLGMIK